jgi:hypothetical protein
VTGPATNAVHDMNPAEQHIALVWVADHYPDVLTSAHRYVRRMRVLDDSPVRKENRS